MLYYLLIQLRAVKIQNDDTIINFVLNIRLEILKKEGQLILEKRSAYNGAGSVPLQVLGFLGPNEFLAVKTQKKMFRNLRC
jgi:hypothetical protein